MPGISQRVRFGGKELASRFFEPNYGPREYQTQRRQPFGLNGELELRGKQGGQTIMVPVRLFASSRAALSSAIRAIEKQVGERGELILTLNTESAGEDKVGEVTFDAAQEVFRRRLAWDSAAEVANGYEASMILIFRSLAPPE